MTAAVLTPVAGACHRLIASRYPTVSVFDDLAADADDLRAAFLLESITNDRLTKVAARLAHLADDDLVQGPGAGFVMAAFLHSDPAGGRFTDHRLGAWYASFDVTTAIAETLYHHERRLKLSDGVFPATIQMRDLTAHIDGAHVDVRGQMRARADLYDPADYTAPRAWGLRQRWPESGDGIDGIVYDSVRHTGGVNVCVYRPRLVRLPVIQAAHYEYKWDAGGAVSVVELRDVGV